MLLYFKEMTHIVMKINTDMHKNILFWPKIILVLSADKEQTNLPELALRFYLYCSKLCQNIFFSIVVKHLNEPSKRLAEENFIYERSPIIIHQDVLPCHQVQKASLYPATKEVLANALFSQVGIRPN